MEASRARRNTPVAVDSAFGSDSAAPAHPIRLRPGMEGVGKVQVGDRKLIWIWTRYLVDWLRIQLWWLLP